MLVLSITGALEHESDGVAAAVGLERDDVVVASTPEHPGRVAEVDARGDVAVAAVVVEALWAEEEGDEGHVAGVHGLEREPGRGAVEVGLVDEFLDRFEDLLQETPLH
ncbi:uncharacterized protein J3R85_013140 [Psidium guajava]|nr:uncharacterized protein J3R85_013140 [Psidium guajava]